jgi:hypothetical protein
MEKQNTKSPKSDDATKLQHHNPEKYTDQNIKFENNHFYFFWDASTNKNVNI